MQIHLSTSDGVPIYQQIASQIKYLVASSRLEPDEQLLPVRKLAEQLVVNPNTVARAYRELETAGVVVSRRGSGVFVTSGQSPLARREQNRIINDRIDTLLAEARQLDIDLETLIKLVRQRNRQMDKP